VQQQLGWSLRPVASAFGKSIMAYQVVAPHGQGCVDLRVQSPLRLHPCESSPIAATSPQVLEFDSASGHLGRPHPMQDGSEYGYVNIAGGTNPDVGEQSMQFTHSYGPDQPNEEYAFVNGTFRDRCSNGKAGHAGCPARCVVHNTSAPNVGNNAQYLVQDVGWQIWAKPLSEGAVAVLILNRDVDHLTARIDFASVGLGSKHQPVRVRDLHLHTDVVVESDGEYTATAIGPHDSLMLKLTPLSLDVAAWV